MGIVRVTLDRLLGKSAALGEDLCARLLPLVEPRPQVGEALQAGGVGELGVGGRGLREQLARLLVVALGAAPVEYQALAEQLVGRLAVGLAAPDACLFTLGELDFEGGDHLARQIVLERE